MGGHLSADDEDGFALFAAGVLLAGVDAGRWLVAGDGFDAAGADDLASVLAVPFFPPPAIPATTADSTNRPTIAAAKMPQPFARLRFFGGAAGGDGGTVTGAPLVEMKCGNCGSRVPSAGRCCQTVTVQLLVLLGRALPCSP